MMEPMFSARNRSFEQMRRMYKSALLKQRINPNHTGANMTREQRQAFLAAVQDVRSSKEKRAQAAAKAARKKASQKIAAKASERHEGSAALVPLLLIALVLSVYVAIAGLVFWAVTFWAWHIRRRPISTTVGGLAAGMTALAFGERLSWEGVSILWIDLSSLKLGLGSAFDAAVEAVGITLIALACAAPVTARVLKAIGDIGYRLARVLARTSPTLCRLAMLAAAMLPLAPLPLAALWAGAFGAPALGMGPAATLADGIALVLADPADILVRGIERIQGGLATPGLRLWLATLMILPVFPTLRAIRIVKRDAAIHPLVWLRDWHRERTNARLRAELAAATDPAEIHRLNVALDGENYLTVQAVRAYRAKLAAREPRGFRAA